MHDAVKLRPDLSRLPPVDLDELERVDTRNALATTRPAAHGKTAAIRAASMSNARRDRSRHKCDVTADKQETSPQCRQLPRCDIAVLRRFPLLGTAQFSAGMCSF